MRAHLLLAPVLSATALLVGCEWTSSDGITWDNSYNNVNFSGTYNLGTGLTTFRQNVADVKGEQVNSSGGTVKALDFKTFAGEVGGIVEKGSFTAQASASYPVKAFLDKNDVQQYEYDTYYTTFSDNGEGVLVGKAKDGTVLNGSITYDTGAWSIPKEFVTSLKEGNNNWPEPTLTKVTVSWRTMSSKNVTPASTTILVQYVVVHQSGQNVSMTFDNGYTFSGKISGFNTDADSIEQASSVIAKFNVSGSNGKIVGSLNSLATSRQLDGVWTHGKESNAIVGSAVGSGRTISENTTPTTVSSNADAVE